MRRPSSESTATPEVLGSAPFTSSAKVTSRGGEQPRARATRSGQAINSSMAWPICRAKRTHTAVMH
jgi:hypothetical protein